MSIEVKTFKRENRAYWYLALARDDNNPYGIAVSIDAYIDVLETYPPLVDNLPFRLLFETLFLKRCKRDKDTKEIVLSNRTLAYISDKERQWKQNNFNGESELLIPFRDAIFNGDKELFDWSDWEWSSSKDFSRARVITRLVVDDALIDRLLRIPTNGESTVYFCSGIGKTLQTQKDDYTIRLTRAGSSDELPVNNRSQQLVLDAWDTTPIAKLSREIEKNKVTAQLKLDSIKGPVGHSNDDTDTISSQQQLLNNIVSCPKMILSPVKNSYRLYGGGMQVLDSRVTNVLLPDYTILDLKSAYASIVSTTWDCPMLREYLSDGSSLWSNFIEYFRLCDIEHEIAKRIVKQPFYAYLFGMSRENVNGLVKKNMQAYGIERNIPSFSKHPLMREIIRSRGKEIRRIEHDRGTITPYGFLPYNTDKQVTTHLSHAVSAYELALITPVFEVIENRSRDVALLLYQWDGCTLDIRESRRDSIIAEMKSEVLRVASSLAIPTLLECK